jgi:superfamily I DNA/RNA helicase/CRISPR/Cas system-associated exonuclease Cas4 (RecB family)
MRVRLVDGPKAGAKGTGAELAIYEDVKKAVEGAGERTIVWASAGTGKSTAIIERVIKLIESGIDPKTILVIAYGRERANELRDLIVKKANVDLYKPLVRTFHAIAFSILNVKSSPEDRSYVLMSGAEQESFIRELLNSGQSKVVWPESLSAALKTRGFVKELRELISRALEFNLTPEKLEKQLLDLGEPWAKASAEFYKEYLEVWSLSNNGGKESPIQVDTSSILHEAIKALKAKSEVLDKIKDRYQHILVDDFQESDQAQRTLLEVLSPKTLFLVADPDSAVGRFRGADPDGVVDWVNKFGKFTEFKLNERAGVAKGIEYLDQVIASRIGGAAKAPARKSLVADKSEIGISFSHCASESDAAHLIAEKFRKAHLMDGVDWSEMAVVLRSPSSLLTTLNRAFLEYEIPVAIDPQAMALQDNPVIKPLLMMAKMAIDPDLINADNWSEIEEVLRSPYCGADSISLRQMRIWLAKENNKNGEMVNTTTLMLRVIEDPTSVDEPGKYRSLVNCGELLAKAAKAKRRGADIYEILWEIWDNAKDSGLKKIAESWREEALNGGVRGLQADRDLDAVIYLFQSAIRYITRNPASEAISFIEYISGQEVLGDAIANTSKRDSVVEILTVHSTQGRRWKQVAIFGLQEGVWPNLKMRGSLLGSDRLVESIRSGLSARDQVLMAQSDALVDDERRLLHVAISRATERLTFAIFSEEGAHPSRYAEEISETLFDCEVTELEMVEIGAPLTLGALVAKSRRELLDENKRAEAAKLLATLSASYVRGANPDAWLGTKALSTDENVIKPGEQVVLSPSTLDSFRKCPLQWFLQKNGGRDGDSSPQLIGTAIHALASDLINNPNKPQEEFAEAIEKNFALLSRESGWVKDLELTEANNKIRRLFEWLEHDKAQGRSLVGVEQKFSLEIGRAIVNGTVDRIEFDKDGNVFIVDLKTGKKWSKKELEESFQVKVYQLAAQKDSWVDEELHGKIPTEVSGGALAFFAKDFENIEKYELVEPALNETTAKELEDRITEVADSIADNDIFAKSNALCRSCALRASCPIQPEGKWVI